MQCKPLLINNIYYVKKLNEGYPEFGIPEGFYDSSTMRSKNPQYRKTFTDAVRYFTDNRDMIEAQINQSSASIQPLYQHLAQSPMLKSFKDANVFKEIIVLPLKAAGGAVNLSGRGLNKIKFTSSKVVGNTVGIVRWRAGKLKDDAEILQKMLALLQPGDILLEKTPFTLTDKSIPGHFGHAAIYVGSVDQLREMNALDLAIVQKNLRRITEGRGVVEALRNGVQLNKLQDFMNVDDIVILRPKHLTLADRLEAVKLALGNLGKKYDFNFDVNTTDTIVCSELVYIAYPQVDFMTKNVLGSFATVSYTHLCKILFRVEVRGLENVPNEDRLLIVANHESFLDGLLLGLFLPKKATFVVHTSVLKKWSFRQALRLTPHLAVDPSSPLAMKKVIKLLESGQNVVIFPEGRITLTGNLMKVYDGPGFVAGKTGADILPVRIDGAAESYFGRLTRHHPRRLLPKVTLTIMPTTSIAMPKATHHGFPTGKQRRRIAGEGMRSVCLLYTSYFVELVNY